ncbi:MAG: glycosyltransferase family 39 protein, partial [Anaerolineaceae bacterium]|nr:glycosyltransferase family 39 protein [Anaerolineaceae bacterium]
VTVFSWRPWLGVISDYHLPNNHIFHSLLVKVSSAILGAASWAVRFPAFLGGILCVPAGYGVARQIYGRVPALFSAGLIAVLPMLIDYSANARGYTLYMLFSLLVLGLAIYLSKHNNLAGWFLFVVFSILGFYTVPFMLYPMAAVGFWLFSSSLVGVTRPAYNSTLHFMKYLLVAGLVTAVIVVLLYSPIAIVGTGLNSLLGNSFIARLSWADFWPTLGDRIKTTWGEWNYDVPLIFQGLLAAGTFLSVALHTSISRVKVPVQITTFVSIFGILLIQRPDPLTRLWTFLIPLWLIWACGGLITPLTRLRYPWNRALSLFAVVAFLILSGWSVLRVQHYFPGWQPAPGPTELVATYLKQTLVAGDAVAVVSPDDAPLWFYLQRLQIAGAFVHHIDLTPHERIFVVVNTIYAETPQMVLEAHNLSPDTYQVSEAATIARYNTLEIYRFLRR